LAFFCSSRLRKHWLIVSVSLDIKHPFDAPGVGFAYQRRIYQLADTLAGFFSQNVARVAMPARDFTRSR
jgi:hypothetical protein